MDHKAASVFAVVLLALLIIGTASAQSPAVGNEIVGGLRKITFEAPLGKITIFLPAEIVAGDKISGTVRVEPNGKDDKEKAKNLSIFWGYTLTLFGEPYLPITPFSEDTIDITAEAPLVNNSQVEFSSNSGRDQSAAIPIKPRKGSVAPLKYIAPPFGQTGRFFTITGPFDGAGSNTNVTIGGSSTGVIAETPRSAVFMSPLNVTGPTEIKIKDRSTRATLPFRNVGISLSAPKINLLKGEKTSLTIHVSGLQGITSPIPVKVITTGSVNTEGGNTQTFLIPPGQVAPDGTFSQTLSITGTTAGGFNVTATVLGAGPP